MCKTTLVIFRRLLWPVLLLPLTACMVYTGWDSKPFLDDRSIPLRPISDQGPGNWGAQQMFVLPDIAFAIRLSNYVSSANVMVIPPIPYAGHFENKPRPTFQASVELQPNTSGFVLDPTKIIYTAADGKTYTPTSNIRIVECHKGNGKPVVQKCDWVLVTEPIVLHEGVRTWLIIEYATATPDPAERFSMQIAGLVLNGESYSLPAIKYRRVYRFEPMPLIPG